MKLGLGTKLESKALAMSRTIRNKVLRKAVTAGTKVILRRAKALVPKDTGLLKKSLGDAVRTYRGSGTTVGVVGPRLGMLRVGMERDDDPARYGHLVEFGTEDQAPQPYLRPALEGQESQIKAAMAEVITKELG